MAVVADSKFFFTLLENLETQHWTEVRRSSCNIDKSIFSKLVQDVAEEYGRQMKALKMIMAMLAEKCAEEVAVLKWEIQHLRGKSAAFSHTTAAEGRDLLPQLKTQVAEGGPPRLISHILSKMGRDINIDDTTDDEGQSLLHLCAACVSSDPLQVAANVRLLGQRGCNPQRRNRSGKTALGLAAAGSTSPIIEALLRIGASPEASFAHEESPLRILCP